MPAYFRWGFGPIRFSTRLTSSRRSRHRRTQQAAPARHDRRAAKRRQREAELRRAAIEAEKLIPFWERTGYLNDPYVERSTRTYYCTAYDVHHKNRGTQFCVKTGTAQGLYGSDYDPAQGRVWHLDIPMDDDPELASLRNGRDLLVVLTPDRSAVQSVVKC